jgi:hypothetical protein
MSRIRSIHPGFFTDEDLVSVSLAARLLFLGLTIEADDKGIFEWKPLTIKMKVFPADNIDVASELAELEGVGSIFRYSLMGKTYGAIRNFRRFQRPKTPNDLHPISPEMRIYVGLDPAISEPFPPKGETLPPKGEKSPQMEEVGGKREEVGDKVEESGAALPRENDFDPTANLDDQIPADLSEMQSVAKRCCQSANIPLNDIAQFNSAVRECRAWVKAGADPPMIIETVEAVMARHPGKTVAVLKYFQGAISDAIQQRKALENGQPPAPRNAKPPKAIDPLTQGALDRMAARRAADQDGGVELLGRAEQWLLHE